MHRRPRQLSVVVLAPSIEGDVVVQVSADAGVRFGYAVPAADGRQTTKTGVVTNPIRGRVLETSGT